MKVFISWSKSLSQECAQILRDWIKCTLQASKPWMSSEDLDKGTVWFNQISSELSDTSIGIICLTAENKNNPWILFESGALAKGLEEQRVYTLLIDLKPKDIEPPLSQFNHTAPTKTDMKKLLISINKQLGSQALEDSVLEQVFNMYWPQFDKDFKAAIKNHPVGEVLEQEIRSSDDMLSEILNTTRNLDKRLRSVENSSVPMHIKEKDQLRAGVITPEVNKLIEALIFAGSSPGEVAEKLSEFDDKRYILSKANEFFVKKKILHSKKLQSVVESNDNGVYKK